MGKMTHAVHVGGVQIGGGARVSIQSMTNTKTDDVPATVAQIKALGEAGCDIVRLAVPDENAAKAIEKIKEAVSVPLVADIHFDARLALMCMERGIDKVRINPGNIGDESKVAQVAKMAKAKGIPIRIGVNTGSLEKSLLAKYGGPTAEAMVESAKGHMALLEAYDFHDIVVSLKASSVTKTLEAYRLMAKSADVPLHVGVTEAGTVYSGTIKSAVGIGALLAEGIGDTIRVSLTGDPVEEVRAAREILKALDLAEAGPRLISCPTCGRTRVNLIGLANEVEKRLEKIKKPITVAVMGCAVNGPGEAREADVGIAGGNGEGLIFRKGEILRKVPEEALVEELMREIEALV